MDSNIGWILADNEVFKTTDGGKTWKSAGLSVKDPVTQGRPLSLFLPPTPPQPCVPMAGGDIYFANNNEGWVLISTILGSQIFHTGDGGKTWKFQFSGGMRTYNPPKPCIVPGGIQAPGLGSFTGQALFMNSFFFTDNKKGCAIGDTIFCTEDGGLTWKERLGIELGNPYKPINGFSVKLFAGGFGDNTGWVVGRDGLIMKTEDGGKKWKVATRGAKDLHYIDFINPKTGWGVRGGSFLYREIGAGGVIMRTDDGGDTWEVQKKFALPTTINSSFFINSSTGWMVGWQWKDTQGGPMIQNSLILHTTNGGNTWEVQSKRPVVELLNVYFTDTDTGWVVGDGGLILHTKDAGKTWKSQKSGTKLTLNRVYFVNNDEGWIIGGGYTDKNDFETEDIILHTRDGGGHWHIQWLKKNEWLYGMFFVNSTEGWITGDNLLLYTDDGGKTWHKREIERGSFISPFFVNERKGWILVDESVEGEGLDVYVRGILLTEDDGKTWRKQKLGLHKYPWRPF